MKNVLRQITLSLLILCGASYSHATLELSPSQRIAEPNFVDVPQRIDGDNLVFIRNVGFDVYQYNLFTKKLTQITSGPGVETYADISGNLILFTRSLPGAPSNIYVCQYNPNTDTCPEVLVGSADLLGQPRIKGNKIAWIDYENMSTIKIHYCEYDVSTQSCSSSRILAQGIDAGDDLDILDNGHVIWTDNIAAPTLIIQHALMGIDPQSPSSTPYIIYFDPTVVASIMNVNSSKDFIVYEKVLNNFTAPWTYTEVKRSLYKCQLVNNICVNPVLIKNNDNKGLKSAQMYPKISGNFVVFQYTNSFDLKGPIYKLFVHDILSAQTQLVLPPASPIVKHMSGSSDDNLKWYSISGHRIVYGQRFMIGTKTDFDINYSFVCHKNARNYGAASNNEFQVNNPQLNFTARNSPVPGGNLSFQITGGLGGVQGVIFFSKGKLNGTPVAPNTYFFIDPLQTFAFVPYVLDSYGAASIQFPVPQFSSGATVYAQSLMLSQSGIYLSQPIEIHIP